MTVPVNAQSISSIYPSGQLGVGPKVGSTPASNTNNMQIGGWYNNPATGSNQRYWGNNNWTSGADPGNSTSQPTGQSFTNSGVGAGLNPIQQNVATQVATKQSQIQPLTDRYNDLINTIKNQGQTQVNQQTVTTANEMGKRGIPMTSTLAGQSVNNAILPIEQNTQGLVNQAGFSREADIKAIQDAITNIQSGGLVQEQAYNQQQVANAVAQLNAKSSATSAGASAENAQTNKLLAELTLKQSDPTYITGLLKNFGIDLTGNNNSSGQTLPGAKSWQPDVTNVGVGR